MVGWSKAMLFSLISQWGWKLKTETNETVNKVKFVCCNRCSWAFRINHTIKRFCPLHVNIDIDIVNIDSQYIVQQIIMPWRKHQWVIFLGWGTTHHLQAKPVCSCFCLCLISIVYPPRGASQCEKNHISFAAIRLSTKSCVVLSCSIISLFAATIRLTIKSSKLTASPPPTDR